MKVMTTTTELSASTTTDPRPTTTLELIAEDAEDNSIITGSSNGDWRALCQGSALKDCLVIGLLLFSSFIVILLIICCSIWFAVERFML